MKMAENREGLKSLSVEKPKLRQKEALEKRLTQNKSASQINAQAGLSR